MDKEKYLRRIQQSSISAPHLNNLKELQKNHLLNIPFENLDIHYQIPIELNIARIFNKVVENKRGGFCYELNGLFYQLLRSLGFKAKMVSARVFDKDKGYGEEFDHMAIIVSIDNREYLCDVGFGEFTFEPLELVTDEIQDDDRGNFLIDKLDEHYYRVNKIENGRSTPEYIFQTHERELKDFQKMCTYHQTSPKSHFTQKRLISLPVPDGRITITGNKLKITEQGSEHEVELKNEDEFLKNLKKWFNIEKI